MRGRVRAIAPLVLAAALSPALAEPRWQVEAGAGIETLSNDSPDWQQADIAVRRIDAGTRVELNARTARRYGLHDRELGVGLAWPVGADWTLGLRAHGAKADFLPRLGAVADVSRRLGDGWVASAGLGRNLYDPAQAASSGTSLLRAGLEHYAGPWRLAGGVTRARLDGGAGATGWSVQLDHYFGDVARAGLLATGGRELESAPEGVLTTGVQSLVVLARLPLADGWSLAGEAGLTRVSDLERSNGGVVQALPGGYRRHGLHLGVQREF